MQNFLHNDSFEKTGGSIVFIESNFTLQQDFNEQKKEISESDEYTFENLINNFRNNFQNNKKNEVSLYLWGSALYSLKRYDEAIEKFKEAAIIKPDYYEVYISWANTLLKLGKCREACEYYEKSNKLIPGDANLHFNWGNALFVLKNYEEAEAKFSTALELNPNNISCYNNLASTLYQQQKYKDAYNILLRAQRLEAENSDIYISQAFCLIKLDEINKAKKIFETALEYEPKNPKALVGIANLFYMLKKFEDSVIYYKKALQYIDGNPYLYNNVGISYLKIGSIDTAEKYLKKSLEFSVANNPIYDVYANLANIYIDKKEYKLAIEYLEKYAEANKYNVFSKERLAKAYTYTGDYEKALKTFNEILDSIDSKINDVLLIESEYGIEILENIAFLEDYLDYLLNELSESISVKEIANLYIKSAGKLYHLNRKSDAFRMLKKAEDIVSDSPYGMIYMGRILFDNGEEEKAANYLEKAIRLTTIKEEDIYEILVHYQLRKNKINEAINTIGILKEISPESITVLLLYGLTYTSAKDYEKAEQNLTEAMTKDPLNPRPKLELGKMYLTIKEYDKAIEMFKLITETDPSHESYYYLAIAYKKINKLKLSIQSFRRAIALNKNETTDYKVELAKLYYEMNEYQEIINLLASITNLISADEYKLLGVSYIELKRYEDANTTLQKIPEENITDPEIFYLKGFANYKLNILKEAKINLNKALSINKKYSKALSMLGDIYFDNEEYKEAFLNYNKVVNTRPKDLIDNDAKFCKKLAISSYEDEKYDVAEEYVKKALKLIRVDHELYYYLGLSQMKKNNYQEAVENLLTATELKTNFVEAYMELGKLFTIMGSYKEAVAIFNKAKEFPQKNSTKNHEKIILNKEYWAKALIEIDEKEQAIEIFELILEDFPTRVPTIIKYAKLLSEMANIEEAINKYKIAINIDPKSYEACIGLGDEYFKIKDYIKSSQYYSMSLQINDNDKSIYYKYALSLYHLSSYDEAITPLKKIILEDEKNTKALLLLSKIYLTQIRIGDAISNLEKYNSIIDNNVESLYLLGLSHYLARNYEKTIDIFKKLISENYTHYFAFYLMGMSYYCVGKKELALEFFEKTIKMEDTFIQAYHYMGVIYYENEEYSKAISYFENSETLNEYYGEAQFYKTCCYINLGKIEETAPIINKTVEHYKDKESILIIAGLINIINNNQSSASKYLKTAHSINPNSPHLPYYFSLISRMDNNLNEAEKYLNKEYQLRRDDPSLIYELALLQIEKKNYVEATQYLQLCIKKDPNHFKAFFTLGIISMEAQNCDNAKRYFERALSLKANDKNVLWYSAINEYRLQDYESALNLFQNVLPKISREEEYLNLYYLGMCQYNLSDIIVAKEYFNQSIKCNNKFFNSLYMYGKCCFELSILDEGYRYYYQAGEINPTSYELFIEWANRLIEDKLYDEALEILDRAKVSSKNKVEPYLLSVKIYELTNDKEKAVSEYAKIINLTQNNYEIMLKYARTLNHLGEYFESVETYRKALKLREADSEILFEFAETLINAKMYDEAEFKLLELLKKYSNYQNAYLWLGITQTKLEKFTEAITSFDKSEKLEEFSTEMISCWAFSLYKIAEYDKAIDKYNLLIELSKASDDDYFYAGQSAFALQNYNLAADYFSEILLKSSNYVEAYIPFATSLLKSNQKEEALEVLEMAEKTNPYNYDLYLYWGELFLELNLYNEAIEKFQKASSLKSNEIIPHLKCAEIYKIQENYEASEKEYRKSLLIEANNISCILGLSDILIRKENYKDAINLLNHALGIDNKDVAILTKLALSYHKSGQYGYAESYYANIYELNPESFEINLNYANLLFEINKYEIAKDKFEFVIDKEPNNSNTLMKLGITYHFLDNGEKAKKLLYKALKLNEENPLLYEYLGIIEYDLKNYKEAYTYLIKTLNFVPENYNILLMASECSYIIGEYNKGFELYNNAYEINKDINLIKKWIEHLFKIEDFNSAYKVINKLNINKDSEPDLCRMKGKILYNHEKPEKALPYLISYYSKFNNDLEIIIILTKIYIDLKMYEDAYDILIPAYNNHQDNHNLMIFASKVNRKMGNLSEALLISEKIIKKNLVSLEANIEYAECLAESGDVKKAIVYFESVVSSNPNLESTIRLIELYLKYGDLKSAIELIKENINIYSNNAKLVFLYGLCFYKQKKYEKAIEKFHKSDALESNNLSVILHIAKTYTYLGQYDMVNDYFKIAMDIEPNNINILIEWSDILYESMDYQKALSIIDKALMIDPENTKSQEVKAKILFDISMYEEAYTIYSIINPDENSNYDTLKKYALSLKYLGKIKEALKIFSLFEGKKEFEPRLYIDYMQILLSEGIYDKIIQLSEIENVKNSFDARIKKLIGDAYFNIRNYHQAEKNYKYAIKSNLINTDIFYNLAVSQYYTGKYGDAKQMLQRAINQDKSNYIYHYYLGLCNLNLGLKMDAISDLTDCVSINPEFYDGFFELGKLYFNVAKYEEGHKTFEYVHKYKNDDSTLFKVWTDCLIEIKKYDLALDKIEKAIDIEGETLETLEKKASILINLSQYSEAIDIYTKLLNENSNKIPEKNIEWVINLSKALYKIDEYEKAFEKLETIKDKCDEYSDFITLYGKVAFSLSNKSVAKKYLRKAINLNPGDIELYINYGDILVELSQHEKAIEIYKKAILLEENISIYLKLGLCYFQLKKDEIAISYFETYISTYKKDEFALYHYAVSLINMNQKENAIVILKKIIKINPGYKDVVIKLSDCYYETGRNRDSLKVFKENKKYCKNYDSYLAWAKRLHILGHYEEAISKLSSTEKYNTKRLTAKYLKGEILLELNRVPEALEIFKYIIKLNSDNFKANLKFAEALSMSNENIKAIEVFERCYLLNPLNYELLIKYGKACYRIKDYNKAIELYKDAIQLNANISEPFVLLGKVYSASGKNNIAIQNFKNAIKINNSYELAYLEWGNCLFKDKKYNEAIIKYSKALNINPSNHTLYKTIAECYYNVNNIPEAVNFLESAISYDFNPATELLLAKCKKLLGNYKEAIKHFKSLIHKKQYQYEVRVNLAELYCESGEIGKSIKEYKFLISNYKSSVEIYVQFAKTLMIDENYIEAYNVLSKSIEKEIDNIEALHLLGICAWKLKEESKAISIFEEILKSNPKSVKVIESLCNILVNTKNYKKADVYLDKILEIDNHNSKAMLSKAELLFNEEKFTQAKEYAEKSIMENKNNPDACKLLGFIYSKEGNAEKSLINFQKAILLNPDDLISIYELAMIYYKRKNYRKAEEKLAQIIKLYDNAEINVKEKIDIVETHSLLGSIYNEWEEFDKALEEFRLVKNIINNDMEIDNANLFYVEHMIKLIEKQNGKNSSNNTSDYNISNDYSNLNKANTNDYNVSNDYNNTITNNNTYNNNWVYEDIFIKLDALLDELRRNKSKLSDTYQKIIHIFSEKIIKAGTGTEEFEIRNAFVNSLNKALKTYSIDILPIIHLNEIGKIKYNQLRLGLGVELIIKLFQKSINKNSVILITNNFEGNGKDLNIKLLNASIIKNINDNIFFKLAKAIFEDADSLLNISVENKDVVINITFSGSEL